MANKDNYIDDKFPFDLTKSLDHNLNIIKKRMIENGMNDEEAAIYVIQLKNKHYNEDGTIIYEK